MQTMQTITITGITGRNPVTIPTAPNVQREGACLDLIILAGVHIGCPISAQISLRTDGTVRFFGVRYDGDGNRYAHVDPNMYGPYLGQPHPPTEAQRLTIARWWAGIEKPLGLHSGVGRTLLEWAFDGMDIEEVEDKYLDGHRVQLAW